MKKGKNHICRKLVSFFLLTSIYLYMFSQDIAKYQPEWIKDGFADGGTTHEPWMFMERRNNPDFNQWWKDQFDYRLSEEYIKSLSEAGVTVYHVFCYKGYGFEAEKESMRQAAEAAALAHKYGMKVDTYIQWNNMFYETFFNEVPEAETEQWYKTDENGRPIILGYGYAPYRRQICFNNKAYLDYFKEKVLRYAVDSVKTDFIHFDNFSEANPYHSEYNEPTIAAFRKYLENKYTPDQRLERFGFSNLNHILPPIWNDDEKQKFEKLDIIQDPVMQEWCDFRCWSLAKHLTECSRFVRSLNKEIVIEVNAGGLYEKCIWKDGIDHGNLLRYTNVIWAEGSQVAQWKDERIDGKFRNYKLGRTTNNFILCYNKTPQGYAEKLAYNRTPAWLGLGVPSGEVKQYLDFWYAHKELYTHVRGAEKVAILYSYPSMAYNLSNEAPENAEQILQQSHIPYDVIFDQQLDSLGKYAVLVLANQECLADTVIQKINRFVKQGGGLVVTGRSGLWDNWRRLRKPYGFSEIFETVSYLENDWKFHIPDTLFAEGKTSLWGSGRAIYLPDETNKDYRFIEAVEWASANHLPLRVEAPEWVGVSHDTQPGRDIVHLINYRRDQSVNNVVIEINSKVGKAWSVSPDHESEIALQVQVKNGKSKIVIPRLNVYEVVILEK